MLRTQAWTLAALGRKRGCLLHEDQAWMLAAGGRKRGRLLQEDACCRIMILEREAEASFSFVIF